MQSFGKAVRSTVSALSLGLMATAGLAAVTVVAAPAAMAQAKASQKFVENYTAAGNALKAKDWTTALSKADAAFGEAANNQQKAAVEGIRVQAYHGKGDKAGEIKALEALGALDSAAAARNKDTLMNLYAQTNPAKAVEMMKANIGSLNSQQLGFLAQRALEGKNYPDAIKYAGMAIDKSRQEGKKPSDAFFNIKIKSFQDTKNLDGYYKTLEEVAPLYPKEIYFRPLIDKAAKDAKFNRQQSQLDLFRAYLAAKVNLKTAEKSDMLEQAFARKMWAEAEAIADPLVKDGTIGGASDGKAERNKRMIAEIQTQAKAAKAGALTKAETDAAAAPTGLQYVEIGEGYFGLGDYKKAAEVIKKGLDKGQMKPEEEALAKLRLGIAQYKGGQKDAARATWGAIKADNGAESLARAWITISKT
jgi:hypothetical protein